MRLVRCESFSTRFYSVTEDFTEGSERQLISNLERHAYSGETKNYEPKRGHSLLLHFHAKEALVADGLEIEQTGDRVIELTPLCT